MTVEEMKDFKAEIVRDAAGAAGGLQFFEFSGGRLFMFRNPYRATTQTL